MNAEYLKIKTLKSTGTMTGKLSILCSVMLLLINATGYAAPADVWKTGETACYSEAGTAIECDGTGQDGELQKGAPWPSSRFKDNKDGTVTDGLTGLIWLKDANCLDTAGGVSKSGGMLTWADALVWSNNLASGSCGLSDGSRAGDWRLPGRKELLSLVDFSHVEPSLPANNPFTNTKSYTYWSSSTYPGNTMKAWFVFMRFGYVGYVFKDHSYYAWPVRGGQSEGPVKTK